MPRATHVIAADLRHGRSVADTVILDGAQRGAAKGTATSVNGATIDIDLHGPVRLRGNDLLLLDDGTLVEVVAAPEALLEARAADLAALARIAWHLGDRHIQAELLPNRVRVRNDAAVEALLTSLGARVATIEAPFEPEGGAYTAAPAQTHDHHHDHAHDCGCGHDHAAHDHVHGHGHRHD